MYNYIIKGGTKLSGEIDVSGSKNATLPILAATILNGKTTKLYNVPDIADVRITLKILESLGCKIKKDKKKIIIDSKNMKGTTIPEDLMRKLRSSVIIAGAIISRFGEVCFTYPGGCDIGSRPIDLHLSGFKKLSIKIDENTSNIICKCDKIKSTEIQLDFPSVGATENLILASVLGNHEVVIKNAAMEPEIFDLSCFLNRMGAKIYGAGTNIIKIKGVKSLNEVSYTIMPDRIEAGTLLIATAITQGNIKLNKVCPEHISPILHKLVECGCNIETEKNSIYLKSQPKLIATDIKTMPYPGFPTDLQPLFTTLLTISKGTSIVTENIFENRYKFTQELKRMGAKINIEGKTAIIKGVKRLHGANVESTDLRGGASLVIAGLSARGTTKVRKVEYILRGYEEFDKKLNYLGANISREEERNENWLKNTIDNNIKIKKTRMAVNNAAIQKKYKQYNKIKKNNKGILGRVLIIFAIVILAIILIFVSGIFNISEIIIEGNDKISNEQIISISQIQKGSNVFSISKKNIEKNLQQNSYINNSVIKRILPNKIKIYINERQAEYAVEYANGYFYIDSDGHMLEISNNEQNLPIIIGMNSEFIENDVLNNEDLKKLNMILKIMKTAKNNELDNLISKIDVSNEENYIIYLDTQGKVAYLGNGNDLNTRFLYIKAILKEKQGKTGEIFVNVDLNSEYVYFREK